MSDPEFIPDELRIDPATVEGWFQHKRSGGGSANTPPRPKGKFLRGPVPLDWLRRAAGLPGKALAVGLALWFLCGCRKRKTVRLTRRTLDRLGVARKPGYRGLRALERAGLVAVARQPGRSPVVTIREGGA